MTTPFNVAVSRLTDDNVMAALEWAVSLGPMLPAHELPPMEIRPPLAIPVARMEGDYRNPNSEIGGALRLYEAYVHAVVRHMREHGPCSPMPAHTYAGAEFESTPWGTNIYWPEGLIIVLASMNKPPAGPGTHGGVYPLRRGWIYIEPVNWLANHGNDYRLLH